MLKFKKEPTWQERKLVAEAEKKGRKVVKEFWNRPAYSQGGSMFFPRGIRVYDYDYGFLEMVGNKLYVNGVKEAGIPISLIDMDDLTLLTSEDPITFPAEKAGDPPLTLTLMRMPMDMANRVHHQHQSALT